MSFLPFPSLFATPSKTYRSALAVLAIWLCDASTTARKGTCKGFRVVFRSEPAGLLDLWRAATGRKQHPRPLSVDHFHLYPSASFCILPYMSIFVLSERVREECTAQGTWGHGGPNSFRHGHAQQGLPGCVLDGKAKGEMQGTAWGMGGRPFKPLDTTGQLVR